MFRSQQGVFISIISHGTMLLHADADNTACGGAV